MMADEKHSSNEFPREITFKVIFYNKLFVKEMLINICADNTIDAHITERESRQGKFISYTITAMFAEEKLLHAICSHITQLDGFITMF
ncbi:MAG TPA: DUF493 family protein [Spirochaetota bacterium]|nr:DUF493 family protein [Spirochaetota bacterium]HOR93165.1 DUF493 family protein [Spirochaetota bacterium]HPK44431.1 DUF493 family protein [Spirochaetota bacterium]